MTENRIFEPQQFADISTCDKLPISSLMAKIKNKTLNMNPDYQRGSVWNSEEKPRLISSLLGKIIIPPLLLNKTDEIFTVIDGKQRLTTIKEFTENKFKIYNEDEPDNSYYYKDLHETLRDKFNDINISTNIYHNLTDDQQRNIFEKINYGEALSIGEKIKGLNSKFLPSITDIVKEIQPLLSKLNHKNTRNIFYETVCSLIALFNKDFQYVNRGKSCLAYIKKMDTFGSEFNIKKLGEKIIEKFKTLAYMFEKYTVYCIKRKYKKKKKMELDVNSIICLYSG